MRTEIIAQTVSMSILEQTGFFCFILLPAPTETNPNLEYSEQPHTCNQPLKQKRRT